jgi:hypothetical protein
MEAIRSCEKWVNNPESTQRHIPEDVILQITVTCIPTARQRPKPPSDDLTTSLP